MLIFSISQTSWESPLHLIRYEDRISDTSQGLYGAGAHTDYGLFTLLATDDVPGLQKCKERDAKPQIWEDVSLFPVDLIYWTPCADVVGSAVGFAVSSVLLCSWSLNIFHWRGTPLWACLGSIGYVQSC